MSFSKLIMSVLFYTFCSIHSNFGSQMSVSLLVDSSICHGTIPDVVFTQPQKTFEVPLPETKEKSQQTTTPSESKPEVKTVG